MKVDDYFPEFTKLVQKYRSYLGDVLVYSVDAGEQTDYNIVMKAALFDDDMEMIGDSVDFIVAKEWLLEYYKDELKEFN